MYIKILNIGYILVKPAFKSIRLLNKIIYSKRDCRFHMNLALYKVYISGHVYFKAKTVERWTSLL